MIAIHDWLSFLIDRPLSGIISHFVTGAYQITCLVSIRRLRMRNCWFPNWKAGIFCPGKGIEGLRGGVRPYAAQARPKIDTARAEKHPFRTETANSRTLCAQTPTSNTRWTNEIARQPHLCNLADTRLRHYRFSRPSVNNYQGLHLISCPLLKAKKLPLCLI